MQVFQADEIKLYQLIELIITFTGVKKIMVTGASVQCSKEALRLTRLYPGMLYSSAGGFLIENINFETSFIFEMSFK